MDSPAFVPAGALPLRPAVARAAAVTGGRPRAAATAGRVRMASEIGQDDKEEVRDYFTNTGFGRWNKIYSDDDSVNVVQKDIREGHAKTVDTVRRREALYSLQGLHFVAVRVEWGGRAAAGWRWVKRYPAAPVGYWWFADSLGGCYSSCCLHSVLPLSPLWAL